MSHLVPGGFVGPSSESDLIICKLFRIDTSFPDGGGFRLERRGERLRLTTRAEPDDLVLEPDPKQGPLGQRLRTAGRKQPLARAIGLHRRLPTVFDATAGMGRDALVLAHLGATVVAVERVPVLAALLWDLARRAGLAGRLAVQCGDAGEMLAGLLPEERPDVVYLDPMFGEPGQAQVKKEMQVCRLLAGPPGDLEPLFAVAMQTARERVVVKRPAHDAPIGGQPSFQVPAASVRFDVYLRAAT